MVDQQPQLASWPVQARHRQVRLPQRDAGHRERVDRVRLALLPAAPPLGGHQPRRDPQHRLTRREQVGLQPTGEMPAILDRPPPLRPPLRPGESVEVALRRRRQRTLGQLLADIVDRDQRVGALMRVDTDRHHGCCLLESRLGGAHAGRWTRRYQGVTRLLSSHADRRRARLAGGTTRNSHSKQLGSEEMSQPARRADRRTATGPTDG
jgi:hypothetical protein